MIAACMHGHGVSIVLGLNLYYVYDVHVIVSLIHLMLYT